MSALQLQPDLWVDRRFRIREALGSGASGSVFLAEQAGLNRLETIARMRWQRHDGDEIVLQIRNWSACSCYLHQNRQIGG